MDTASETRVDGALLRVALPADAPAILALEAHFPSDRMSERSVRRLLGRPSAIVRVAAAPEIVASLVLLTRRGSRRARVYSLVVSPEARGRGLARALVAAAEQDARARGCTHMSLEVRGDNHAARRLYAALGYAEHCVLPAYYSDGADGLRLHRALAP